jgi:hypothetical protein
MKIFFFRIVYCWKLFYENICDRPDANGIDGV